jgi:beta-galactosidase
MPAKPSTRVVVLIAAIAVAAVDPAAQTTTARARRRPPPAAVSCRAPRPLAAEVAVVYNPLAHFVGGRQWATAYGGPQGEVAGIERDSLLGVYRALFGRNVPLDFVHINHLGGGKLRPYKLVVFPYPLMMPAAAAAPLAEYVRGGGTLVAEARLGWNDERGRAAERIPGLGLCEVMRARETAVQTAVGSRTELTWTGSTIPGLAVGERLRARWYEETLEPIGPDARVVATFPDGAPAAVQAASGNGRTLLLGSYVSAAYQTTPTPEVERFYAGLLAWAGVTRPVLTTGDAIEVRFLEAGPDRLLFVLNHASAPATSAVSLRVPDSQYAASDLITGRDLPVRSSAGGLTLDVVLAGHEVQVVRLSPGPSRAR